MEALALIAATFVSEDLACVSAGVLIARGDLPAAQAITACAIGIFIGDLGLWGLGRLAHRWLWALSVVQRRVSDDRLERARVWLERHAGLAIVASRFTPGTRLPLYVAAGVVRLSLCRFAIWTLPAILVWTSGLVLISAGAGRAVVPGW
jgi:membrane protein DedA with SNARE-associated domain